MSSYLIALWTLVYAIYDKLRYTVRIENTDTMLNDRVFLRQNLAEWFSHFNHIDELTFVIMGKGRVK